MSTADISKTITDYLATQPVTKAWLFGSYARGEQREGSEVDLVEDGGGGRGRKKRQTKIKN